VNPWLILAAVLAVGAAGGAGYVKGRGDGQAKVQAAWDAERIQQQEAHNQALRESIEKQQALQLGADQLRQEKDRETRELAARNTALVNSLRSRPERPTAAAGTVPDTAESSGTRAACTGAGLSRQDAEFLAGEAARGDEARLALKQCYAQYEAVRLKLGGGATAGK
jgi:hypothetical protein